MNKRIAIFAAKAVVSGGLLWLVLNSVDFDAVAARLADLSPAIVIGLLVVLVAQEALASFRWQLVSRACGFPIAYLPALKLFMIGFFFNQALPSTIGGDAVRIWHVSRAGAGPGLAIRSVLLDRLVAFAALLVLVAGGLPVLFAMVAETAPRLGVALVLAVGASLFGLALAFDLLFPVMHWRWRVAQGFGAFSRAARGLVLSRLFWPLLAISVFNHVVTAVVVWSLARDMGIEVGLDALIVLLPSVMLVSTVPVSIAGWGVREGAMVAGLSYVGVIAGDAFALSVLFGVLLAIGALPGGPLWLAAGRGRPRTSEEAGAPSTVEVPPSLP